MKTYFKSSYVQTLRVYKYSRAMYFNGDLYGSMNSIHSNSSMIHAKSVEMNTVIPAFVTRHMIVKVVLQTDNAQETTKDFFLSRINWLEAHSQKNWFSPPVEVWLYQILYLTVLYQFFTSYVDVLFMKILSHSITCKKQ